MVAKQHHGKPESISFPGKVPPRLIVRKKTGTQSGQAGGERVLELVPRWWKYSGCHLHLIILTSTHIISGNEHPVNICSVQSPVSTQWEVRASGWAWKKYAVQQGRSHTVQWALTARRLNPGPGLFHTSCCLCHWDLVSELHWALILSLFIKWS